MKLQQLNRNSSRGGWVRILTHNSLIPGINLGWSDEKVLWLSLTLFSLGKVCRKLYKEPGPTQLARLCPKSVKQAASLLMLSPKSQRSANSRTGWQPVLHFLGKAS